MKSLNIYKISLSGLPERDALVDTPPNWAAIEYPLLFNLSFPIPD